MDIENKLKQLKSGSLQSRCDDVLDQMISFQDDLVNKIKSIRDSRDTLANDMTEEYSKIINERKEINKEKSAWDKEKERISQVYPINDDIITLNICGT